MRCFGNRDAPEQARIRRKGMASVSGLARMPTAKEISVEIKLDPHGSLLTMPGKEWPIRSLAARIVQPPEVPLPDSRPGLGYSERRTKAPGSSRLANTCEIK